MAQPPKPGLTIRHKNALPGLTFFRVGGRVSLQLLPPGLGLQVCTITPGMELVSSKVPMLGVFVFVMGSDQSQTSAGKAMELSPQRPAT